MLPRKSLNFSMPEMANLTPFAKETTGNEISDGPCSVVYSEQLKVNVQKLCAERRNIYAKSCSPDDCVCMKL